MDRNAMHAALIQAFLEWEKGRNDPYCGPKQDTRNWGIMDGMVTMYALATDRDAYDVKEELFDYMHRV